MTPWSEVQLTPWREDPLHAGVLLDFDGTLAAIVLEPAAARPLDGMTAALRGLVARYGLVAVISGRSAAFLAEHLDVPGVERWGSYGLERVGAGGRIEVLPEAERWREAAGEVLAAAYLAAPAGVGVEDKKLSVTLHLRAAPQHGDWARDFAHEQAARTGLAIHDAKMSIELRPPVAIDKGTVTRQLVERAGVRAALFAGDDRGDLSAFAALDSVPIALRVAVRSDESPPELLGAADIVVDGPAGLLRLLDALAP